MFDRKDLWYSFFWLAVFIVVVIIVVVLYLIYIIYIVNKSRQKLISASEIDFTYILCNADKVGSDCKGNVVDFQDSIFTMTCSRVWERVIWRETMFHVFAPRYLSALKSTVFTNSSWNTVCEQSLHSVFYLQCLLLERIDFLLLSTVAL